MTKGIERQPRIGRLDPQQRDQTTRSETGLHVDLWMRGDPPYCVRDIQEGIYEQLHSLQERGIIASSSCCLWGAIGTSPKKTNTEQITVCREKVTEFEGWAKGHGYTLNPGFQRREKTVMTTDERGEELIPPLLCLAVYKDNMLEAVFPHTDDERNYTVADGLDRLEADTDNPLISQGDTKS